MTRATTTSIVSLVLLACAGPAGGCDGGNDSPPENRPFRGDWEVVADLSFRHVDDEGMQQISSITIGGRSYGTRPNFANRGDVIVEFKEGEEFKNRITIELRKFSSGISREAAEADFDKMELWAFANQTSPKRPGDIDQTANCNTKNGWQNNCAIRVYYDGQQQKERAGADIRVTLPADYQRTVNIITEDDDNDADYYNRGNVCVDGLNGTGVIELQSGQAFVKLNENISIAPLCSTDWIDKCWAWPCMPGAGTCTYMDAEHDEGDLAWAPECPCVNQVGDFGRVSVESRDASAADVTIDIPMMLWASITAQNQKEGQDSTDDEAHCNARVTHPGFLELSGGGNDFPWEKRGQVNYPGPPAVEGAGFSVQARSKDCAPVAATENPNDFVGYAMGNTQKSTERGNIEVCSGCLAGKSCAELLPGG